MIAPRFTFGSRGIARYRYDQAVRVYGALHPAARGALGRWLALQGAAPQRGAATPESVAWHRESGADRGYMNRTHRRAIARRASETPRE